MLFKEKIQRLFLWYEKHKHYTLVFFMTQGQWNQIVVIARHALHKLLTYSQTLTLKTVTLQASKQNQIHCHALNIHICRTWAPLSHSFQPRCCQSQHHHCSHTSVTLPTAAVTLASGPPLTPISSTLWTQEPGWDTARTHPAEQAPWAS